VYLGTQSNIGSKRRELPPAYLTGDTTVYLFTNDKLLTSCIRRYLVSRACEWVTPALSAMLLIFSFQFSLLFLHVGSQAAAVALRGLPKSNIGRCWKCGKFLVRDFELTLTVKLETRHPIDGYFGSQFRVICNHCRAMAAWSCKTWKFVEKFLSFLEKRPPYVKVFKILFQKFSQWHQLMLFYSNFVKYCQWETCEIVHYLPNQKANKISATAQTFATVRIVPKICQGQLPTMYSQCSRFHPNSVIFSGVITWTTFFCPTE